jgi:hypothetical protein
LIIALHTMPPSRIGCSLDPTHDWRGHLHALREIIAHAPGSRR